MRKNVNVNFINRMNVHQVWSCQLRSSETLRSAQPSSKTTRVFKCNWRRILHMRNSWLLLFVPGELNNVFKILVF